MPNKTHRTDYEKYIKDLMLYINDHGIKIKPFPKVHLSNRKQGGVFIKTGYYDPSTKEVYLFVNQRHIKDILRSLAHELVHHHQNLEGRLVGYNGDKVTEDEKLTQLEGEAYLKGNLVFRSWTEDQTKSEKPSQTFGKHMKKKIDLNEAKEMSEIDRLFECFCRKCGLEEDGCEIKDKDVFTYGQYNGINEQKVSNMSRVDEAIKQAIENVLGEECRREAENRKALRTVIKEALDQYLCEVVDSGKWQHSTISTDPFGMGYRIKYNKFPFMHPHVAGSRDVEKSREYIENATNKLLQYQKEHPEEELNYAKAKQIIGTGRHSELNADPIIMGDYRE